MGGELSEAVLQQNTAQSKAACTTMILT